MRRSGRHPPFNNVRSGLGLRRGGVSQGIMSAVWAGAGAGQLWLAANESAAVGHSRAGVRPSSSARRPRPAAGAVSFRAVGPVGAGMVVEGGSQGLFQFCVDWRTQSGQRRISLIDMHHTSRNT